jgi:hypothetical protein
MHRSHYLVVRAGFRLDTLRDAIIDKKENQKKAASARILYFAVLLYARREKDKREVCMWRKWMVDVSVASLATLCGSQLVHLCDTLLELFVLALFVRVSFVLFKGVGVRRLFCRKPAIWISEDRRKLGVSVPRTSRVGSTRCVGSGSAGSRGGHKCLCRRGVVLHRTFPRGKQL